MVGAFRALRPAGFLLATILLAGGPGYANSHASTPFFDGDKNWQRDDPRLWREISSLAVNRNPNIRLVVSGKCEGAGEEDLRHLVETAEYEESFVFAPALCRWFEVGHGETGTSVRLDTDFIERLLRDVSDLTIYHIHLGKPQTIAGYFPAYADLLSLVLLNAKYIADDRVSVRHRVMTDRGNIEYRFDITPRTKRLVERIFRTGLGPFVSQNLAYEFSRPSHHENYLEAIRDCRRLSQSRPENLRDCFPLKADEFVLDFRPDAESPRPLAAR